MYKPCLVLALVSLLAACEPGFVIGEAKYYSRQLGVFDDYNIKRSSTMVFANSSHFAISAMDPQLQVQHSLVNAADDGFSPYFTTTPMHQMQNQQQALTQARSLQANFLALIKVVEKNARYDEEGKMTDTYHSVDIVIDVHDVNSGMLVDKISVTGRKTRLPVLAGKLQDLLVQPIKVVAQELVGEY